MINADRWELRERQWTSRATCPPPAVLLTLPPLPTLLAAPTATRSTYAMSTPAKGSGQESEAAAKGARDAPSSEAEQTLVLVAEDEETIAETLAMIVEDAGYVPVIAHDGREALALARQHRPRIIITDLMMPYMSGAELVTAVRTDAEAQSYTPPAIMVVTAASRAREAGADAIVAKPFDIAQIESVMRRLLSERPD